MDLELKGKNALVTGGERGIGRDVCLALAREGVNVAYCDVRLDRRRASTLAAVEQLGGKAVAAEVDVADEAEVIRWVADAVEALGSVDIFVSNAGVIEWE